VAGPESEPAGRRLLSLDAGDLARYVSGMAQAPGSMQQLRPGPQGRQPPRIDRARGQS
jgi:hypothetical protein